MNNRSAVLSRVAPFLLVPSGCAALIYQVTWVRLLGLSMGSTSAAVSTVLSAFFFGLAIGSYFAERISTRKPNDLAPFVALELAIGASGLVLLLILLNLDHGMALVGDLGTNLGVKFAVCLALLAIPTACMGATFPVLASVLIHDQHGMGSQVGWLYTLNTLGAVAGALLAGFVLTPRLGLDGAVYVACTLNLGVAAAGWYLRGLSADHGLEDFGSEPDGAEALNLDIRGSMRTRVGVVLFFTGFVSIGSEVGWTKYLSIFTGATIYGFSAILGVFLIGMALGSWFAKRYLRTHGPPAAALPWALSALGLSLIIARVALALLPALLDFLKESEYSHEQAQALKYLAVFFALLPGTFVFGSLFPYTLSIYCTNVTSLKSRIGVGYAINTAGSVLGAIAAGFWIIPNFGTDALLTVLGLMILALSWLFVDAHSNRRQTLSALAVTCVLLLASFQLPHLNYRELIAAAPYRFDQDAAEGKDPRFIFLEEGKAGVISIVTYDEKKAILQNNGIQESYLGLIPGIRPPIAEVLLGLVPAFLHPNPTSAFVVGFGGGNTLEALADTSIQEITVVELEPAVIAGVASIRGGRIPVLEDPRIDLRLNDARNVLLVDGRGYDLIISQPSHPWLSGAGNLFTKEFFSLAANHLDDGGIFAQWVNLFNMDSATLRSILQAYFLVFPHGFCLANMDSGDLLLFGSQQQPIFDQQRIAERMRAPKVKRALGAEGIHRPADLLWYFALSRDEALTAASDMPPNTDTRIYSEVRLAGMTVDPTGDDDPYQLLRAHSKLDVIPYLRPHEASQMLYQAGQSFYRHFSTALTRRAIARLEDVDPATADRLRDDWAAWRESVRNRGTAPTKRTKK